MCTGVLSVHAYAHDRRAAGASQRSAEKPPHKKPLEIRAPAGSRMYNVIMTSVLAVIATSSLIGIIVLWATGRGK
jgi:hypothetical protein